MFKALRFAAVIAAALLFSVVSAVPAFANGDHDDDGWGDDDHHGILFFGGDHDDDDDDDDDDGWGWWSLWGYGYGLIGYGTGQCPELNVSIDQVGPFDIPVANVPLGLCILGPGFPYMP